jgi:hypothetical protein
LPWGLTGSILGATKRLEKLSLLVPLCLPPNLRYNPENIFVAGVTPGPSEPTVLHIGNVLNPLVKELLALWNGVEFSGTWCYPSRGRTIRAMILQVICDLPAIRKVMGMAGHSLTNHVCSFCKIASHNLNSLDSTIMVPHNNAEIRKAAFEWNKAKTHVELKKIFAESGVRFSPLLRLPYPLPVSHVVVEPMHNIFLGILKYHGQSLLGLHLPQEKKFSKKAQSKPSSPQPSEDYSHNLDLEEIQIELADILSCEYLENLTTCAELTRDTHEIENADVIPDSASDMDYCPDGVDSNNCESGDEGEENSKFEDSNEDE